MSSLAVLKVNPETAKSLLAEFLNE
ncbi:hypothetical protein LYNGBM3L_39510 [Moorena producens 3L]|uniref:Uncharacterized protein n=1 Tax=Moorena producens 3L TaxID=489825 RepID=F4XV94_9CYAN|nr:hypothetical protein LYNGBM3L_39510 [Moorena producens 3L]